MVGDMAWDGPLAGLRVIDLTRVLAGPFASQILGDLGADVIKIEPPGGDETRKFPPHRDGESHYFVSVNRSKRGMVVDLKVPAGVDVVRRLRSRCGYSHARTFGPRDWTDWVSGMRRYLP